LRFRKRERQTIYVHIRRVYNEGEAEEEDEEVVVVAADAVDPHAAMVVVLHAAGVAMGAVVHPRQLVDLAVLAELEGPLCWQVAVD